MYTYNTFLKDCWTLGYTISLRDLLLLSTKNDIIGLYIKADILLAGRL